MGESQLQRPPLHHRVQVELVNEWLPHSPLPVDDVKPLQALAQAVPFEAVPVQTAADEQPDVDAGGGPPSSVTLIGAARVPSVRSAQPEATCTPSMRTYGTVERVNRVDGELAASEIHALQVPPRPAATARP